MPKQRKTCQRQLLRDLFQNNMTHPTAEEIYEAARKVLPGISRGTVYRNLGILVENGEILHLKVPFGPDHYDSTLEGHYHFLCRCCHKMQDVSLPYLDHLQKDLPELPGCHVEEHQLLLYGVCQNCNSVS